MPVYTLSWNRQVRDIPLDTPVLVCLFGEVVPFMAVRDKENDGQMNIILGPGPEGYGICYDLEQIAGWVNTGLHPGMSYPKDTRVAT